MEDTLPLGGWLVVVMMATAGAWMFLVLRPISSWQKVVAVMVPAVAGGVAGALSFCTAYQFDNLHHLMLASFGGGLLCMPLSSAVLRITESEAVGWIKQGVKRFFGLKDEAQKVQTEESDA